jgi:hypothetical protein
LVIRTIPLLRTVKYSDVEIGFGGEIAATSKAADGTTTIPPLTLECPASLVPEERRQTGVIRTAI